MKGRDGGSHSKRKAETEGNISRNKPVIILVAKLYWLFLLQHFTLSISFNPHIRLMMP